MERVLLAFKEKSPHIKRLVYYDNPESHVPGGYSETAQKIMKLADTILFANSHLAAYPFAGLEKIQKFGLGYFPLEQVTVWEKQRNSALREQIRQEFFKKHQILSTRTLSVYFGGANTVYFEQAFPAFLKMIGDNEPELTDQLFVLQQHPRAKEEGNMDALALNAWLDSHPQARSHFIVSDVDFSTAMILADRALYYQTGAAMQFALLGIPAYQVGLPYEDAAVRSGLAISVADGKTLFDTFEKESVEAYTFEQKEAAKIQLGIRSDWQDILFQAFQID
jgi:hypothetical protein